MTKSELKELIKEVIREEKYFVRDLTTNVKPFYVTANNSDDAINKAFSKLKHSDFHIDKAISDGNTFTQVLSRRLYNLLKNDQYVIEMEKIIDRTVDEFGFDKNKSIS